MSTLADTGIDVSPDHHIGGERVGGDERFEVISPIDQRVLAHVARGGAREAHAAVEAARACLLYTSPSPRD